MSDKLYRWIKASERLPDKRSNYHVRVKYFDDKPECWNTSSVWNMTDWEHPSKYDSFTGLPKALKVYEWLSEIEADQDKLWKEAIEFLQTFWTNDKAIQELKPKYHLIPKQ